MMSPYAETVPKPDQRRRRDLDVMRSLVVLGLVLFHTARIFSLETFYVSNNEKSLCLTAFVAWGVVWGMPLMFLICGQTAGLSLARRGAPQFLAERFGRLMVPFVFAEPYREFLPRFFHLVPRLDFPWFVAAHPDTMLFDAAHLYFLYFLFTFTVIALPLFLYLQGQGGRRWLERTAAFLERPGRILLLGLPVGGIEAALQSENYGGWNRYVFLLLFLYGFVIASDARLSRAIRRHGTVAVVLVIPATAFGFAVYVRAAQAGVYLGHGHALEAVLWRMLKGVGAWWWVTALLGLGGALLKTHIGGQHHQDSGSQRLLYRAVRYANEAVLPFYVLHHPVVVIIGFYVVRWEASVWVKYSTISIVSLAVTFAVYQWVIRTISVMRFLFGMKQEPAA
jgi:hypothetical protein